MSSSPSFSFHAYCGACSVKGHTTASCTVVRLAERAQSSPAASAAASATAATVETARNDEFVAVAEAVPTGVVYLAAEGGKTASFRIETSKGAFVVDAKSFDEMLRANDSGNGYHFLNGAAGKQRVAINADALARLVAEENGDADGAPVGCGQAAAAAATGATGQASYTASRTERLAAAAGPVEVGSRPRGGGGGGGAAEARDYSAHLAISHDTDVSPQLRAEALKGVAVYHAALQHLHAFQRENVSLGREWTSARGEKKRSQMEGRWWFGRNGTPLDADVHVDHVVPYSMGGAHTSANVTLLTGEANRKKGAGFAYEDALSAGGIEAGARAIHASANVGNKHNGKYTGGVPAPRTFFYPKYALEDNDGKSYRRNVEYMRDMARKQKEGTPTRVDGSPDQRYKYKAPLKADGTVDERYRTQSLFRNDVRTASGGGGRGGAAAAAATTTPSIRLRSDGGVSAASAAVRSGAVLLNKDGSVNRSCAAVRSGDVFFTKSGAIDGRCAAARAASSSSAKGSGGGSSGSKASGSAKSTAGGSKGGGRSAGGGGKGGGGGKSGGGGKGGGGGGGRSGGGGGKGGRK